MIDKHLILEEPEMQIQQKVPNIAFIDLIEQKFGKGTIMTLGSNPGLKFDKKNVIPSGSLLLDKCIGIGGYPKGRIVEIYGPESSGKTTLSLHAISQAQQKGGKAAFIDVEHALDPAYAQKLNINIDQLYFSQPDSGEQALHIVEILLKSNEFDLIVIDSVAALVPQIELDGEVSDQTIGAQARLMSKCLRRLGGVIAKTKTTVLFINQLREKIGVSFGNNEVTPGGRALRFYASLRLDVRRIEQVKDDSANVVGYIAKVKIVKNKMSPPFKIANILVYFDMGICQIMEIINLSLENDFIIKKGNWYFIDDINVALGKAKLRQKLIEDPKMFNDLKTKLQNKFII